MQKFSFKKALSGLFLGSLLFGLGTNAFAANPSFNILQGDLEFFTGRNITQNQTDTTDPVSANPNDTVEGVIYYHNGVESSTATNTRISVTVPTSLETQHVLTATLSADNATPITNTVVNGQVVGKDGLTINGSAASTLQIVPNSVRWFEDGSSTATPLLNGQTGDELFTPAGLSLGDIPGCWAHAGYVLFRVKLNAPVQPGQPNIEKSKSAYNDTQQIDATKVAAHGGDHITYTLTTRNSGTADQPNFVIQDGIQDILDYADVVAISDNGQQVNQPNTTDRDDQVLVQYPAVTIHAGETVTRTFSIVVKNPIPTTPANGTAFDMVMFNTYGNNVVIVLNQPVINMSINKLVRDVTKNEPTFIKSDTGSPGDTLEYEIQVKNTGTTAINSQLNDILPNGVTALDNSVSAKTGTTTVTLTGDLYGAGVSLPTLTPGQEIDVYFEVIASDKLADSTNLVNTAKVVFNNQPEQSQASTLILVPATPVTPTTPSKPTPPVTPVLPTTGANPFGVVTVVAGSIYTAWSRWKVSRELATVARAIKIV